MPEPCVISEFIVVAGKTYRVSELSFSDLRYRFSTGRAVKTPSDKGSKATGYRTGVLTGIGDLELSVWETLIRALIERSGEEEMLTALIEWVSENCPWLHSSHAIELYALELHSGRIFDNPAWIAYKEFNKKYRPEYLKETEAANEHRKKET